MTRLGIINNTIPIVAENTLDQTKASLQKALSELSSGMRLYDSAQGPSDISIAAGLGANVAAIAQSTQNALNGVASLQTADGALSKVTELLDRAVTIALTASTGGLSAQQTTGLEAEYQSILTEIGIIGSTTNFNGTDVFGITQDVFLSDGTTNGSQTIATSIAALTMASLGLNGTNLSSTANAQTALSDIATAIDLVSQERATIGTSINRLSGPGNVQVTEQSNLMAAQSHVQDVDIAAAASRVTQETILQQMGVSALSDSNRAEQLVLKLLQ